MSQVIRISNDLYKRLEKHAFGFDTPSNVIETILDIYEGVSSESSVQIPTPDILPADSLDIVYHPNLEEDFKKELLISKKAYIKLYFTNGSLVVEEWITRNFTATSSVSGNLRSGRLRGWKERGIYKAELAISEAEFY